MPTRKRKRKNGKYSWGYAFDLPGSTRNKREQVGKWGFKSEKEAQVAEIRRRAEELQKAASTAVRKEESALSISLQGLLQLLIREHARPNLAPKTVERYEEEIAYLAPELVARSIGELKPVDFTREWQRLRLSGGRDRKTKSPRPLGAKSVRNIAGTVSSAFKYAMAWGYATNNPVTASEKPKGRSAPGLALTNEQVDLVLKGVTSNPALPMMLELCAATGRRRGEVLALRWSDLVGDQVYIVRTLSQTKAGLHFKPPKTFAGYGIVELPQSTLALLADYRKKQQQHRDRYGLHYRTDLDLIICEPNGEPLKPDSVSATVSALCARLKLPKRASLHALRHTHGSDLIADGMEITAVSKRLGHSSPEVTARIYAHVVAGRDKIAAQAFDRIHGRDKQKGARVQ